MISNPNLVFYACIAKGSVILAEFSSKEPGIETLASRCIENAPPHHSMFSHTVSKRTYTFLIHDPFVYFGIFDETLDKSESLGLLNRLSCAMQVMIKNGSIGSLDSPNPHCLESKIDPVFAEIMDLDIDLDLDLDLDLVGSPRSVARESRNPSLDSSKGRRGSMAPLLGKRLKLLNKKKGCHKERNGKDGCPDSEKKLNLCADGINGVMCKELKNGLLDGVDHDRQKAKQIWRKHVWVVLIFDLFVCGVLFGIWLWLCRGFQCIDG